MSAVVSRPPTRKRRPSCSACSAWRQLRREISGGAFQRERRLAIDVLQIAVTTHNVEAGRVELGRGINAPLEPGRVLPRIRWNQRFFGSAVGIREVGGDRRAFGDVEITVLQKRDLLPRVESGVFGSFGLAAAWQDRPTL